MTSPHPYGPHRPEDAPNAVTVLGPGLNQGSTSYPMPEVRPLPAALVRQRERINQLAHEAARHE
jgi:hypothetical protein